MKFKKTAAVLAFTFFLSASGCAKNEDVSKQVVSESSVFSEALSETTATDTDTMPETELTTTETTLTTTETVPTTTETELATKEAEQPKTENDDAIFNEMCRGVDLDYFITDKETSLSSDRFVLNIPKGVYVPTTIVEDIDKLLNAVEKETGKRYINDEYPEKIVITVEKTGTFAESGNAFGSAEGCIISPVELLISTGLGYAFVHELLHTIHFRNGYTMNIAMVEGFATCFTERIIRTGIFPFYFDSVNNYSSDITVTPENAEELFGAQDMEAYYFGWEFVSFITEKFGSDAFLKFAKRSELEKYKHITDDYGTTEETLPLVKAEFGDNIFNEFAEWVNDPNNFEKYREKALIDLSGFDRINASSYFGNRYFIAPDMLFYYNGHIILDYTTALTYAEKYKGYSCDEFIANLSSVGKSTFSFYSRAGELLETVELDGESDVKISVNNAAVVEITGDGKPVGICISEYDDNSTFSEMMIR